jgi:hypothetical protein
MHLMTGFGYVGFIVKLSIFILIDENHSTEDRIRLQGKNSLGKAKLPNIYLFSIFFIYLF